MTKRAEPEIIAEPTEAADLQIILTNVKYIIKEIDGISGPDQGLSDGFSV